MLHKTSSQSLHYSKDQRCDCETGLTGFTKLNRINCQLKTHGVEEEDLRASLTRLGEFNLMLLAVCPVSFLILEED